MKNLPLHSPQKFRNGRAPAGWHPGRLWLAVLGFALLLAAPANAARVFFVAGAAALNERDAALTNRLISTLGHTVVVRAATAASGIPALRDEATTNVHELIIVSESINSGNVADAFTDLAKPVIAMEAFIYDDLLMAGPIANTDFGLTTGTQIEVTDGTHPLAASLSGLVAVYSNATTMGWSTTLGAGAARVASVSGQPANWAIFAYDVGAQMVGRTAPARRVGFFLFAGGTGIEYTTNAFALFDAAVYWSLGLDFPPVISAVTPANGATFGSAAAGLTFQASSSADILTGGIKLVLNDVDVSAGLVITGDATARSVQYAGLADNTIYTAHITVSNSTGVAQTTVRFDTFSAATAVVIEAEDYNYDREAECDHLWGPWLTLQPGSYQNHPPVSGYDLATSARVGGWQADYTRLGYVDAVGLPGIDYQDASETWGDVVTNGFRFCDFVGTRASADYQRPAAVAVNVPEYDVSQLQNGDWMNYTRDFSNTFYQVYLRAASTAGQVVHLDRVTSDRTQSNQVTAFQGVFLVPATGSANTYQYVPLTDALGNTPVTVALGAADTLRLTAVGADNNLFLNYFVLVPAGEALFPPAVQFQEPAEGATFAANATLTITANATDTDGSVTNVKFYATTFASTNYLGEANGEPFTVTWSNVPEGRYTLTAIARDNHGLAGAALPVTVTVGTPLDPVLFLVANLNLNAGDAAVRNLLRSLNLQMLVKTAASSSAADADGKSLVLVSSTINSGDAAAKFRDVMVPVITWEPFILDDLQMAGPTANVNYGTTNTQTQLEIVNAGHPLAAGLAAGVHTVVNGPETFSWGIPNEHATVIAHVLDDPGPAVIYGYDTGGQLFNGFLAPARRVALFMLDTTAANFSPPGQALFTAAIYWALGRSVPVPPTVEITSPSPELPFSANVDITIRTQAQDVNGSVTSVKFYVTSLAGTELLGEDFDAPFEFLWPSVPEGIYTLTAIATDNDGLTGSSAPVTITVGAPTPPVLFVVANLTLTAGDAAVLSYLQNLGLAVVTVTAAGSSAADAQDKILVLVSSSVVSGDAAAKFRDVAVPVITWESFILDDLQMAGSLTTDYGTTNAQTQVDIVAPAHPLAAGLALGPQTVVTGEQPFSWGIPNAHAVVIARVMDDPDKALICAYEIGAELFNGYTAPARRVALFMQDAAPANFTVQGRALFDAAVNWALGRAASPPPELAIARSANTIVLSWPETATDFQLESSPVVPNPADWPVVSDPPPTVQDGRKSVTLPFNRTRQFFRLRKP